MAMTINSDKNKLRKSDEEWRAELTPEQYAVARKHGTERAFTGPYWDEKRPGLYSCVCCGEPLFDATTKYDSGSGWPSFYTPVAPDAVELGFTLPAGAYATRVLAEVMKIAVDLPSDG